MSVEATSSRTPKCVVSFVWERTERQPVPAGADSGERARRQAAGREGLHSQHSRAFENTPVKGTGSDDGRNRPERTNNSWNLFRFVT